MSVFKANPSSTFSTSFGCYLFLIAGLIVRQKGNTYTPSMPHRMQTLYQITFSHFNQREESNTHNGK